jgi:uncharacterized membrane protein
MSLWGLWALFAKLATESLAPTTAMIVSYATSVGVAVGYVALTQDSVALTGRGVGFALAAGVFAGAGAVAYYAGLDYGSTGVVTTVSALYFVVAALLGALFLGEPLGLRRLAGIALATGAVALLAG